MLAAPGCMRRRRSRVLVSPLNRHDIAPDDAIEITIGASRSRRSCRRAPPVQEAVKPGRRPRAPPPRAAGSPSPLPPPPPPTKPPPTPRLLRPSPSRRPRRSPNEPLGHVRPRRRRRTKKPERAPSPSPHQEDEARAQQKPGGSTKPQPIKEATVGGRPSRPSRRLSPSRKRPPQHGSRAVPAAARASRWRRSCRRSSNPAGAAHHARFREGAAAARGATSLTAGDAFATRAATTNHRCEHSPLLNAPTPGAPPGPKRLRVFVLRQSSRRRLADARQGRLSLAGLVRKFSQYPPTTCSDKNEGGTVVLRFVIAARRADWSRGPASPNRAASWRSSRGGLLDSLRGGVALSTLARRRSPAVPGRAGPADRCARRR